MWVIFGKSDLLIAFSFFDVIIGISFVRGDLFMDSLDNRDVCLNRFVRSVECLKAQREILDYFNEMLCFYPYARESFDNYAYQLSVDKYYRDNMLKNFFKSMFSSAVFIKASELIFDVSVPFLQMVFLTTIATYIGFRLFQFDNNTQYDNMSLSKEDVSSSFDFTEEMLTDILNLFNVSYADYVSLTGNTDISYIKDMFDKNSNYIASKKEEGAFSDDFDYNSIIFMFDDLFGENGLDSCLDVFYSHYSDDKSKVRK